MRERRGGGVKGKYLTGSRRGGRGGLGRRALLEGFPPLRGALVGCMIIPGRVHKGAGCYGCILFIRQKALIFLAFLKWNIKHNHYFV